MPNTSALLKETLASQESHPMQPRETPLTLVRKNQEDILTKKEQEACNRATD